MSNLYAEHSRVNYDLVSSDFYSLSPLSGFEVFTITSDSDASLAALRAINGIDHDVNPAIDSSRSPIQELASLHSRVFFKNFELDNFCVENIRSFAYGSHHQENIFSKDWVNGFFNALIYLNDTKLASDALSAFVLHLDKYYGAGDFVTPEKAINGDDWFSRMNNSFFSTKTFDGINRLLEHKGHALHDGCLYDLSTSLLNWAAMGSNNEAPVYSDSLNKEITTHATESVFNLLARGLARPSIESAIKSLIPKRFSYKNMAIYIAAASRELIPEGQFAADMKKLFSVGSNEPGVFSFNEMHPEAYYPLMWASTLPRYAAGESISLCELITNAQCDARSILPQYLREIFSNVQAIPPAAKSLLRQIITDDKERIAENARAGLTCSLIECGALSINEWLIGKKEKFHRVIGDDYIVTLTLGDFFKKYAEYAAKRDDFKVKFTPLMLDVLEDEFGAGNVDHSKLLGAVNGLMMNPSVFKSFIPFLSERLLSILGCPRNEPIEASSNIIPMMNNIWHYGISEFNDPPQDLRDQASNCFIVLLCIWNNALKNPLNVLSNMHDKELYHPSRVAVMVNKMSAIDATLLPLAKEANTNLYQSLLARHLELKAGELSASVAFSSSNNDQNTPANPVVRKI